MQKLDKHTHKHDLMKTQDIIVHPKTLKQFNALKEFMSAFKIDFELATKSKKDSKEEPPAYKSDGTPLTLEEYNRELEEGLDDVKNGRTFTSEELTKRIESWTK